MPALATTVMFQVSGQLVTVASGYKQPALFDPAFFAGQAFIKISNPRKMIHHSLISKR